MADSDRPAAMVLDAPAPIQKRTESMLEVIARVASDPTVDAAKLRDLLSIQERILTDQRRTAFMAALARLQEKLPQIAKSGRITGQGGSVRNTYAKIEDIDRVVRPLCAEEGFSFSFDSKPSERGTEYTCAMHHRDGHTETKAIVLPVDQGNGRNAVQSVGSTTSYARRYLLGMHLNLITREEDDDGGGGSAPITTAQAAELQAALDSLGGTSEAQAARRGKFLNWLAAASFAEIPAANLARARKFIEERQGGAGR